jgi:hypothetical protein
LVLLSRSQRKARIHQAAADKHMLPAAVRPQLTAAQKHVRRKNIQFQNPTKAHNATLRQKESSMLLSLLPIAVAAALLCPSRN